MSTQPAANTALNQFEQERRRLFGVAYRMLGSVSEAEDVLQDAYLRWHALDHTLVDNPTAFLVRMVTNLCLDALGSARQRRTEYVGTWLPEPIITPLAANDDPVRMYELTDDISLALLVVLERLTPLERAVFVLYESLDFSYREIGEIVGKSEQNCRQIARRARQHIAAEGYAAPADPAHHDQLLQRFLIATQSGDLTSLLELLAHDATAYSDGGGIVRAALHPIVGAERVARLMIGVARKTVTFEHRLAMINGRMGMISISNGTLYNTLSLHIIDGRIHGVYVVANPAKLGVITGW